MTNLKIEKERTESQIAAYRLAQCQRTIITEQRDQFCEGRTTDTQRQEILKKPFGFTKVCNNCGSTQIGTLEKSRAGEFLGTYLKCSRCGQEEGL